MADTNNNINVEREEEYKEELRRSFELVKPISLEAAAIFYPTLWEINPATKVSKKQILSFIISVLCSIFIEIPGTRYIFVTQVESRCNPLGGLIVAERIRRRRVVAAEQLLLV